mgnify:CR=1 FL=1
MLNVVMVSSNVCVVVVVSQFAKAREKEKNKIFLHKLFSVEKNTKHASINKTLTTEGDKWP